jgi:hypothetical protein
MKTLIQKARIDGPAHTLTSLEYETTEGKTNLVLNLGHGAQVSINDKNVTDGHDLEPLKIDIQVSGDWEMLGLKQVLRKLGEKVLSL